MDEKQNYIFTPEDNVIASYMMKVLGCHINSPNIKDVRALTALYGIKLCCDQEGDDYVQCVRSGSPQFFQWLEKRKQETKPQDSWITTPVVCYRCKGQGHIARGCREFFCYRCHEQGHVISGCRKKRSVLGTSSPAKPQEFSSDCVTNGCGKPRVDESKSSLGGSMVDSPVAQGSRSTASGTEEVLAACQGQEVNSLAEASCEDHDECCFEECRSSVDGCKHDSTDDKDTTLMALKMTLVDVCNENEGCDGASDVSEDEAHETYHADDHTLRDVITTCSEDLPDALMEPSGVDDMEYTSRDISDMADEESCVAYKDGDSDSEGFRLFLDSGSACDGDDIEAVDIVLHAKEEGVCSDVLDCESDEDQIKPCWTYLSDDLGCDCRNMHLREFLTVLETDPFVLDSQSRTEIMDAILEELAAIKTGYVTPYADFYS